MITKKLPAAAVIFSAIFATQSFADECEPQGQEHAGLYELVDVMEMGSAIWLGANGRFEYMLAYGAVDEVAKGCWSKGNSKIDLVPTDMRVSQGGNKFKKLSLAIRSSNKLIRSFGGGHKGTYKLVRR